MPYIDFDCLIAVPAIDIHFTQGDTEKITKAVVDDINNNGGILGRKLEVVFHKICPLQGDASATACTAMTDDEKVFAVLGTYDTPPSPGTNQLCVTRDHETVLIANLVKKTTIDEAPPGLLIMPGILAERRLDAMYNLIKQQKLLAGKKIAVLGDQDTGENADKVTKAAAASIGIETGSTAVLTITSEDTSAAQTQLDSFIEKWKGENVSALLMSGLLVSAKQFVEKIRERMPNILLISDDSSSAEQAQDEVAQGKSPNPYEGMITMSGLTDVETFNLPAVQKCVKAYESATGEKVVPPDQVKPGSDGTSIKTYQGVQDRCNEFAVLKLVAEKAGANLTNETWAAAVNSFGSFPLPTNEIASLKQGKYDVEDGFRLGAFDSSIKPSGDFKKLTELLDVTK
ncbi:MAG: branched-chain amino acid transport system substrate-binding protein [Acidimicrobiaceae bacterium]